MLLEKELPDTLREEVDGVRDETEEAKDVLRVPAMAVAFTEELIGFELGGAAAFNLDVSPALSASVFRLRSCSAAVSQTEVSNNELKLSGDMVSYLLRFYALHEEYLAVAS